MECVANHGTTDSHAFPAAVCSFRDLIGDCSMVAMPPVFTHAYSQDLEWGSSMSASRGSGNVPDEEAAIVNVVDVVVLVACPSPHAQVRVGHIRPQKALVFREVQSGACCEQRSCVPTPPSVLRRR